MDFDIKEFLLLTLIFLAIIFCITGILLFAAKFDECKIEEKCYCPQCGYNLRK